MAEGLTSRDHIKGPFSQTRFRARAGLPFRAVNRQNEPGYDPGMQRHHLLPRQLLAHRSFLPLFEAIGRERIGFEDFRSNGLLLPASDAAAVRIGLPLHRGPHRDYSALVFERVGQIEAGWSALRLRAPEIALGEAVQRLRLLQRALRRRLLDPVRKRLLLNRNDPLGREADFAEIDAMVDMLWPETAYPVAATGPIACRSPGPAFLTPLVRVFQRAPVTFARSAFAC